MALADLKSPYLFVPVLPNLAIHDTPVLHDALLPSMREGQSQAGAPALLTGELRVELTALTPLHVGNKQVKDGDDAYSMPAALRRELGNGYRDRVISTALCLPAIDGVGERVCIPGSSIKGCLRHALGALLCAPMERVGERWYSFRPNIGFADRGATKRVELLPAVVWRRDAGTLTEASTVTVRLVRSMDSALLADRKAADRVSAFCAARNPLERQEVTEPNIDQQRLIKHHHPLVNDVWFDYRGDGPPYAKDGATGKVVLVDPNQGLTWWDSMTRSQLSRPGPPQNSLAGLWLLRYPQGIDSNGLLAGLFADSQKSRRPYNPKVAALVDDRHLTNEINLPAAVVARYCQSYDQQLSDFGQLKDHPNIDKNNKDKVKAALQQMRDHGLAPGDLVFVEYEEKQGASGNSIKDIQAVYSNFYGRVAYRDSVRRKDGAERREVIPTERETMHAADGSAQLLSAARLFHGYALDDKEPGTNGIAAKGHYSHLAGRVAVNFAVEVLSPEPRQRLLSGIANTTVVAIPQQGSPKPSAVEFYVRQDPDQLRKRDDRGGLVTYGDRLTAEGDPSGDLAGRKFYAHNPVKRIYLGETNAELLGSRLTPLLDGVSTTGTAFRCTIKFRNLRPWELGALLFVLGPNRSDVELLGKELGISVKQSEDPLYAHKLGRGRQFGLGSVDLRVREIATLARVEAKLGIERTSVSTDEGASIRRDLISNFCDKLRTELSDVHGWARDVLTPWLAAHDFHAGMWNPYPAGGRDNNTLGWHSNTRKEHAGRTKEAKAPPLDRKPMRR